jgi:hypothetical protein
VAFFIVPMSFGMRITKRSGVSAKSGPSAHCVGTGGTRDAARPHLGGLPPVPAARCRQVWQGGAFPICRILSLAVRQCGRRYFRRPLCLAVIAPILNALSMSLRRPQAAVLAARAVAFVQKWQCDSVAKRRERSGGDGGRAFYGENGTEWNMGGWMFLWSARLPMCNVVE